MAEPLRVLGIAGSLRARSFNRALLRAAQELAPPGMTIGVHDIRDIPPYDGDVEAAGDPEPVARLKQAIRDADALLIATPEYNYGIPGVLKNAIDWASRPPKTTALRKKPGAILGASTGSSGTMRAQLALRQTLGGNETYLLLSPQVFVAGAAEKFDNELRLTDEKTRDAVRRLLDALVNWTQLIAATAGRQNP